MAELPFGSARTVNPEAGDYPISLDQAERTAAEAAVRASWREFPYYAKRYGERGWRFSLSDTGWIQTLCHASEAEAQSQILWFAEVLASRGMPSYLLERHLQLLHLELMKVAREREERYRKLLSCASYLRARREARIPATQFAELAEGFEKAVLASSVRIANMGTVIVGGVADELAGFREALSSVVSWVCDASKFDDRWVAAASATISAARASSGPPPGRT